MASMRAPTALRSGTSAGGPDAVAASVGCSVSSVMKSSLEAWPASLGHYGHRRDFGAATLGANLERSWRQQVRPDAARSPHQPGLAEEAPTHLTDTPDRPRLSYVSANKSDMWLVMAVRRSLPASARCIARYHGLGAITRGRARGPPTRYRHRRANNWPGTHRRTAPGRGCSTSAPGRRPTCS